MYFEKVVVVVQLLSHVWLFTIPWTAEHQASLTFTISWSFFKLMSMESVMPSNHLIFCCPLLLLPSIFPRIRIFSNESAVCIRWPKYWSFSLTVSTSKEYSGFISFGLISLLSKGLSSVFSNTTVQKTILQLSAFFMAEYFYLELSNFNIPLLLDNKFY